MSINSWCRSYTPNNSAWNLLDYGPWLARQEEHLTTVVDIYQRGGLLVVQRKLYEGSSEGLHLRHVSSCGPRGSPHRITNYS